MTASAPHVRFAAILLSTAALVLGACSSGNDSGSGGLLDLNNPAAGPGLTLTGPTQLGSGSTGNYVARLAGGDGKGVSATPIKLTTTLGTLAMASSDGSTDVNGELPFTLTARKASTTNANGQLTPGDPVTGTATLTATGAISGRTYTATLTVQMVPVTFTFTSPTSTTVNPAKVPVNVRQTLSFQWFSNGVAVNAPVTFTTQGKDSKGADLNRGLLIDGAGNTASTLTLSTQNGVVSLDVISSSVGPAIVNASDGGQNSTTLPLQFTGGEPASVVLTAATPIAKTGASTVTAVVKDASGNAVNNVSVSFALVGSTPSAGSLSSASATTDSTGTANVVYNANGASGTATVQATVGSVSPVTQNIVVNP